MVTPLAVGAAAAAVAGAKYIDARFAISRDLKQLRDDKKWFQRLQTRIQELGDHVTIYHMLELAKPENECLWFEGKTWTYGEFLKEADALAEIFYEHGIREGDFVAVMMTNSPEMLFTISAISKLGAAAALVNTALRHHTLLHCMSVVGAKFVVCTPDHTTHLFEILDEPNMPQHCLSVSLGSFPGLRMDPEIDSSGRISHIHPGDLAVASTRNSFTPPMRKLSDVGLLIYTSGTSGKPKAVSVKNHLLLVVSTPLSRDVNNPKKYYPMRTFSCLPMFHGTGLFTGFFYSIGAGQTLCLARKFSASTFTRRLVECRATRTVYVGELCRYLLRAPQSPYDDRHSVIVAAGNGLSKDVWTKFTARFNIPEVREFYRSTEGIAKFDNFGTGKAMAGKVGFEGPIARRANKTTYLVKYDTSTEQPWRDPRTGFCVEARVGEPGEAIGRVVDWSTYSEYLNNPEANEKKIIRDVFAKGDAFQRSGDLLMRDKEGWVYFMDRSGDTYRWNGENVSAGEVRDHIAKLPEVQDVVVYGIRLTGYDGQAGAATVTLYDHRPAAELSFMEELYPRLRTSGLTVYQLPRLLRLLQRMELNATFKHAKASIKERSWDPDEQNEEESVWWLDGDTYKKLERKDWERIKNGKARL